MGYTTPNFYAWPGKRTIELTPYSAAVLQFQVHRLLESALPTHIHAIDNARGGAGLLVALPSFRLAAEGAAKALGLKACSVAGGTWMWFHSSLLVACAVFWPAVKGHAGSRRRTPPCFAFQLGMTMAGGSALPVRAGCLSLALARTHTRNWLERRSQPRLQRKAALPCPTAARPSCFALPPRPVSASLQVRITFRDLGG